MLPCVSSVKYHGRRQNMVRTSVGDTLARGSCATVLFLSRFARFYVICDLLLNRRTTTWNQFAHPIFHE